MRVAYDAIYNDIKHAIEAGEYHYESLLPSESEFIKKYDCAHNTVRRALHMLADEGYVQPIHGKGVRVIYRPGARNLFVIGGIETFAETNKRLNLGATTRVVTFERMIVDEPFAAVSGFAVGCELIHLERVRCLKGLALIHDKNYLRADAVDGLTQEQAGVSVYSYIEDVLHRKIVTSKRLVTVERATVEDKELLDIEDIDFLAVVTSNVFDGEGQQFEYTQSRHNPDFFSFYDTATRNH